MKYLPRPRPRGACRLLLTIGLLAAGSAQAQWAWRDANGEMTYSDSPPPAGVEQSEITHQPTSSPPSNPSTSPGPTGNSVGSVPTPTGTAARPETPAASPQAPQANRPNAAPKSLAEQDADFRKRLAEKQKTEEKQAEDEAQTTQRTEACNQAKSYLDTLQSGTRLLRPDANGDRNFLDDDQRAAEIQKTQDAIEKNC